MAISHRRFDNGSRGYVYFVTDGTAIKIGFSVHVEGRMDDLQGANPTELRILVAVPSFPTDESAAHRHFANLRIRGEWFRPEKELTDFIEVLKQPSINTYLRHWKGTLRDVLTGHAQERVKAMSDHDELSKLSREYDAWLRRRRGTFTSINVEQLAGVIPHVIRTLKTGGRYPAVRAAAMEQLSKLEAALSSTFRTERPSH